MPITSHYGWSELAGRYIDLETGRFVSFAKIRNVLESVMDASAVRMNILSQQLVDGSISIANWQVAMKQQIKIIHVNAGMAANGGFAQMSQSDWGAVGQMIRAQYGYLDKFAQQIANGEQALDGRLLVRSDMYGDAARGTFEQMERRLQITNGFEEERRVLEDKLNNCDGCLEQAALNWQPIGTLDPIGAEECTVRCRCEFEYRRVGENGEWEESEE